MTNINHEAARLEEDAQKFAAALMSRDTGHGNIIRAQNLSAAIKELASLAHQAQTEREPVPGAVWVDGSVSLIQRGREDDYCERWADRGAKRIYFAAPSTTQGQDQ